jgi:hypothetical protein
MITNFVIITLICIIIIGIIAYDSYKNTEHFTSDLSRDIEIKYFFRTYDDYVNNFNNSSIITQEIKDIPFYDKFTTLYIYSITTGQTSNPTPTPKSSSISSPTSSMQLAQPLYSDPQYYNIFGLSEFNTNHQKSISKFVGLYEIFKNATLKDPNVNEDYKNFKIKHTMKIDFFDDSNKSTLIGAINNTGNNKFLEVSFNSFDNNTSFLAFEYNGSNTGNSYTIKNKLPRSSYAKMDINSAVKYVNPMSSNQDVDQQTINELNQFTNTAGIISGIKSISFEVVAIKRTLTDNITQGNIYHQFNIIIENGQNQFKKIFYQFEDTPDTAHFYSNIKNISIYLNDQVNGKTNTFKISYEMEGGIYYQFEPTRIQTVRVTRWNKIIDGYNETILTPVIPQEYQSDYLYLGHVFANAGTDPSKYPHDALLVKKNNNYVIQGSKASLKWENMNGNTPMWATPKSQPTQYFPLSIGYSSIINQQSFYYAHLSVMNEEQNGLKFKGLGDVVVSTIKANKLRLNYIFDFKNLGNLQLRLPLVAPLPIALIREDLLETTKSNVNRIWYDKKSRVDLDGEAYTIYPNRNNGSKNFISMNLIINSSGYGALDGRGQEKRYKINPIFMYPYPRVNEINSFNSISSNIPATNSALMTTDQNNMSNISNISNVYVLTSLIGNNVNDSDLRFNIYYITNIALKRDQDNLTGNDVANMIKNNNDKITSITNNRNQSKTDYQKNIDFNANINAIQDTYNHRFSYINDINQQLSTIRQNEKDMVNREIENIQNKMNFFDSYSDQGQKEIKNINVSLSDQADKESQLIQQYNLQRDNDRILKFLARQIVK